MQRKTSHRALECCRGPVCSGNETTEDIIASRPSVDIEKRIKAVPYVEIVNHPSTSKYAGIKRRFDVTQHEDIDARLNVINPMVSALKTT